MAKKQSDPLDWTYYTDMGISQLKPGRMALIPHSDWTVAGATPKLMKLHNYCYSWPSGWWREWVFSSRKVNV